MTAQLHRFPVRPLVAARDEIVAAAHVVLRSAEPQTEADIRTACCHLRDWGGPVGHVLADQAERALAMRRAERAEAMRLAVQQEVKRGTIRQELRDTAILLGWFAVLILVLAL